MSDAKGTNDVRLVFSDMDSTYLAKDKTIPEGNLRLLDKLQERGIAFVPCSGSTEAAELRFAEMLDAHAARLRSSVHFGRGRLLKAFPDLRSYTHDEILKELKKRLEG